MDPIKVRALLTALAAGRLAKAADRLGYTPSGMSRLIAGLEKDVGTALLLRDRSGLRPTASCQSLLPAFQDLLAADDRLTEKIQALQGLAAGSLTVGAAYSRYYPRLSKVMAQFSGQFPGIKVQFVEGTSSELATAVSDQRADFCIISEREGDFSWTLLQEDELIALVPEAHPLAAKDRLTVQDLCQAPFITIYPSQETDNSRLFASYGLTPPEGYSTADVLAGAHMVEAGLGLTLVNAMTIEQIQDLQVIKKPLWPAAKVPIGVALAKEAVRSPAADAFYRLFFAE
ncbi:LysR family transcriptional regulator [Peptococcus simiae]|uniref:LysR family transcriptional regulator n=1 Tax=Peptococcus simiae TaxID=1643805 RepID=UPI00397F8BA3